MPLPPKFKFATHGYSYKINVKTPTSLTCGYFLFPSADSERKSPCRFSTSFLAICGSFRGEAMLDHVSNNGS